MHSGDLLRHWVDGTRANQKALAAKLGVAASNLSNWKTRGVPLSHLRPLDKALDAGGVFHALSRASTTPNALEPSTRWDCNFADDLSSPMWGWVRLVRPGRVRIRVKIGLAEARFDKEVGEEGVFITAPASIDNPPARVELSEPAWIDFGQGPIPSFLPVPAWSILRSLRPRQRDLHPQSGEPLTEPYLQLWVQHLINSTGAKLRALPRFMATSGVPTESVSTAIANPRMTETLGVTTASAEAGWKDPSVEFLRGVREARGISQAELALLLNDQDLSATTEASIEISEDQIYRIEQGLEVDHALLARIDQALDARGGGGPYNHSVLITLGSERPNVFSIPFWWRGRVWFAPSEPTTLVFKWDWYRRTVRVTEEGAAASMLVPLNSKRFEVTASPAVDHLKVGYGELADAHDIADAWMPHGEQAIKEIRQWGQEIAPAIFALPKRTWNWLFRELST